jgi:hypothetical protein
MLRPTKHSHPDRTIIYASTVLLSRLRKRRIEDYDSLRTHVKSQVAGGEVLFLPALNLLFLLGLVNYHTKTDALEYVGQ